MEMNKKILIVIVLIVVFAGFYGLMYFRVQEASSELFDSMEVTDISLLDYTIEPPSADLLIVWEGYNPSNFNFKISISCFAFFMAFEFSSFSVTACERKSNRCF